MFLFGDKNKTEKRSKKSTILKTNAPVAIQIETTSETIQLVTNAPPNLSADNLNKYYSIFVEDEVAKEKESLVPPKIDALNGYNKKKDDKKHQEAIKKNVKPD